MVGAVILGAGMSTRMNSATSKLEMNLQGIPVIEHVIRSVCASGVDRVVLVYSSRTDFLKSLAQNYGIGHAYNPIPQEGLSTSLKTGVRELLNMEGLLFVLGDQPFVYAEDIDRLLEAFEENEDKIIVPVTAKGRGNPVIIPRKYYDELLEVQGDQGARGVIASHRESVLEVLIEKSDIHFDIDTEEAFKAACARKKEARR